MCLLLCAVRRRTVAGAIPSEWLSASSRPCWPSPRFALSWEAAPWLSPNSAPETWKRSSRRVLPPSPCRRAARSACSPGISATAAFPPAPRASSTAAKASAPSPRNRCGLRFLLPNRLSKRSPRTSCFCRKWTGLPAAAMESIRRPSLPTPWKLPAIPAPSFRTIRSCTCPIPGRAWAKWIRAW